MGKPGGGTAKFNGWGRRITVNSNTFCIEKFTLNRTLHCIQNKLHDTNDRR